MCASSTTVSSSCWTVEAHSTHPPQPCMRPPPLASCHAQLLPSLTSCRHILPRSATACSLRLRVHAQGRRGLQLQQDVGARVWQPQRQRHRRGQQVQVPACRPACWPACPPAPACLPAAAAGAHPSLEPPCAACPTPTLRSTDGIGAPDNLSVNDASDVLFVGEDAGSQHQNDYVWAYDVSDVSLHSWPVSRRYLPFTLRCKVELGCATSFPLLRLPPGNAAQHRRYDAHSDHRLRRRGDLLLLDPGHQRCTLWGGSRACTCPLRPAPKRTRPPCPPSLASPYTPPRVRRPLVPDGGRAAPLQ